jgi:hypothetical protein
VGLANLGSESETCVGSRVRLVGVFISIGKNFYRLPFTPPLSGSPYRSFISAHECRAASNGGTEGGTEGKEEPRGERRGAARRLTPELLLRRMRESESERMNERREGDEGNLVQNV